MTADAHAGAVLTMRQEIYSQPRSIIDSLNTAATAIERAAELVRRTQAAGPVVSFGIGDSDLVGRLAAEFHCPPNQYSIVAASALEIWNGSAPAAKIVIGHSISGTTPVTIAAAEYLRRNQLPVIAMTASDQNELAAKADAEINLFIPRFEPDAKVPGTITVTTPLGATSLLLEVAAGVPFSKSLAALEEDLALAFEEARQVAAVCSDSIESVPSVVHVVVSRASKATALYAQAKFAETASITATASDTETWGHVFKHAVGPHTLVLALPAATEDAAIYHSINLETTARGGRFMSSRPLEGSLAAGDVCRILPEPHSPPSRVDVWRELFFVQFLVLSILERAVDRAPYQLHLLSKDTVRGLCKKSYHFK